MSKARCMAWLSPSLMRSCRLAARRSGAIKEEKSAADDESGARDTRFEQRRGDSTKSQSLRHSHLDPRSADTPWIKVARIRSGLKIAWSLVARKAFAGVVPCGETDAYGRTWSADATRGS